MPQCFNRMAQMVLNRIIAKMLKALQFIGPKIYSFANKYHNLRPYVVH